MVGCPSLGGASLINGSYMMYAPYSRSSSHNMDLHTSRPAQGPVSLQSLSLKKRNATGRRQDVSGGIGPSLQTLSSLTA